MDELSKNKENIKGWGIDADPLNDPTYPMKKYTGDDHQRLNYQRASQQPVDIEVLHSNERPNVTAVFGTPTPPSGLSGAVRRYAFKYSESSYGHWLPLLIADRINVVEGIIEDLKGGHIPNIFAEMGWKSEWEHNRKGVVKKVLIGVIAASTLILLFNNKNKSKKAI